MSMDNPYPSKFDKSYRSTDYPDLSFRSNIGNQSEYFWGSRINDYGAIRNEVNNVIVADVIEGGDNEFK